MNELPYPSDECPNCRAGVCGGHVGPYSWPPTRNRVTDFVERHGNDRERLARCFEDPASCPDCEAADE